MGRSHLHGSITINTINIPSCSNAPPINRDSICPGIRVGVSHNLSSRLLTLARGLWRLREEEYEKVIEGGNYRISII